MKREVSVEGQALAQAGCGCQGTAVVALAVVERVWALLVGPARKRKHRRSSLASKTVPVELLRIAGVPTKESSSQGHSRVSKDLARIKALTWSNTDQPIDKRECFSGFWGCTSSNA